MNPATPDPLTVLLVPPDGDTALLADEAGCGRVPMALPSALPGTRFVPSRIDGDICGLPGRALLLVHEGAPVAMGCDRAVRLIRGGVNEDGRPVLREVYTVDQALGIARVFADLFPGARVVLLRDGREVPQ